MIEEYLALMMKYASYMELTLTGSQGSTAQFWIIYIQAVFIFYFTEHAVQIIWIYSSILLYWPDALQLLCCSRPNYGRWIVRYHMNLLNVDKTHPGVCEVLQSH